MITNQLTTIAALPTGAGCRAMLPPEVCNTAHHARIRGFGLGFDEILRKLESQWREAGLVHRSHFAVPLRCKMHLTR